MLPTPYLPLNRAWPFTAPFFSPIRGPLGPRGVTRSGCLAQLELFAKRVFWDLRFLGTLLAALVLRRPLMDTGT